MVGQYDRVGGEQQYKKQSKGDPWISKGNMPSDPKEVFAFQNLTFRAFGQAGVIQVLHGVSACIPVRTLCGVLGPSGAGKSSMFDTLLGVADMSCVDGNLPLQERISYVTQDSQLVVSETVLDVMWFYANLALPRTTPVAHKRQLIEDILYAMDMSHTQDTYVGGIEAAYGVLIEGGLSSGERRRLQVCATLISKPEIIILDEPTTGLDATNALHLVRVLKRLCRDTSMTAVASLHQCRREIMLELDSVILLCKGRMVYTGPATDVIQFCSSRFRVLEAQENPMDYILEFLSTLTEQQADKCNALNNEKVTSFGTVNAQTKLKQIEEQGKSFQQDQPNFYERCRVLTGRFARIYWYKWSIYNVFGPLFLALVTGLFLACMCLNINKDTFLQAQNFMNMLALTVFTLARNGLHTSAVCGFARTCWYQEKSKDLYKAGESFLALQFFEVPMGCFFGIVCYLVMWIPVGWGYDNIDRLAKSILLFMFSAQAFRSLFAVVQLSSRMSSSPRIIATFSLIEATGGLFMKWKMMPIYMRWVCYINPFFYTIMGLTMIEFDNFEYPDEDQHIVKDYGFDDYDLSFAFYMLTALFAFYTVLSFYLYAQADFSAKRVVDGVSGEAPLTKAVNKVNPFKKGRGDPLMDGKGGGGYGSTGSPSMLALNDANLPQTLQYINITYSVLDAEGQHKEIIHGVSFNIKRGTMFAIMGPSGAGKTSLLKIIGGFNQAGTMNATYLAGITPDELGYVTADDLLPVLETCHEVLMFYAEFGLPASIAAEEKKERVTHVMELMGLNHVRNSFVGGSLGTGVAVRGISGGEKRRVSIGCALLKNPAVVVLDEPTSGLDAVKAMEVLETCEQLTRHGRTIICTIHQPRLDIYNMFSHVMYVAMGEVVYVGPPQMSVPVLEQASGRRVGQNENPADFVLDCLVGLEHEEIVDMMSRIPKNLGPQVTAQDDMRPVRGTQQTPEHHELTAGKRFQLITNRLLREIWRDQEQAVERIKFIIITCTIFSLPYDNLDNHHLRASEVANRRGLMMLMTKFCVVQASNTIPVIQQQRALCMHEMKLGFYRPWEFYMSQVAIAVGIFSTLGSVIGFHVTWLLAGYRTGMHYWSFGWANAFIMSCFSEIMAVILATNLPSYPAAAGAFTGPFTCCLLPLCGLFIATPHLPYIMRGLAYYNPMYYCAGAEVLNQFKDRELIQDDFTGFYVGFTSGNEIVEELGYDHVTGNKYYNAGIAVAQAFLLAVVGYRSLRQLVRQGMMGGGG